MDPVFVFNFDFDSSFFWCVIYSFMSAYIVCVFVYICVADVFFILFPSSYALFPLLLLLDAAVASRSPKKVDSEGEFKSFSDSKMPHKVGDQVAEGILLCLEELLIKCHLGSVEQVI